MIDYKGCIFDLDGTLLDSMGVWRQVDEIFLGKRGLQFTDQYLKAVSVMTLDLAAEYTVNLFNLKENPKDIIQEWLDLARNEFAYHIQPKPYGVEYVKLLKEKNIPIAVATSCQKELYIPALKRLGIYDIFDIILDSDMTNCSKERPDIFIRTAKMLEIEPKDCLVFEDTVNGVKSAKEAGFVTVGFLDQYQPKFKQDLIKIADYTAEDFKLFYEDLKTKAAISNY